MSDSVEQSLMILTFFVFMTVGIIYLINRKHETPIKYANFIKGVWERKGTTEQGEAWYIRYLFENDTFEVFAEPHLHIKGSYKIASELENLLILDLYNIEQNGKFIPFAQMPIAINHRQHQLTIENKVFKQV